MGMWTAIPHLPCSLSVAGKKAEPKTKQKQQLCKQIYVKMDIV